MAMNVLLLSPLKINKPYGTLTGTGSFGDCLTLKRRLILPSFVDPLLNLKIYVAIIIMQMT